MTYSPGNPGYPPANQPTTQFSAPTQQFGKVPDTGAPAAETASKLPTYLLAAVAVLGLAVYLANFGPIFTIRASDFLGQGTASGSTLGIGLAVVAAVLAGLIAAASLLPKQRPHVAVAAVVSLLGFLLVLAETINKPAEASIGWALYLLIAFSVLQAAAAVAALLFDSGIINPPAPRPKYDQPQYGQYGGPQQYYGQQPPQQHHGGPAHQQAPQQQRPGYPSQYGGYGGSGPSTGGFPAVGPQNGPPTPPTGFPTYGQPHQQQQPSGNTPTTQLPSQPQSSSSQQSGPTPS
jgi:Family of unknown function (DUF5336)